MNFYLLSIVIFSLYDRSLAAIPDDIIAESNLTCPRGKVAAITGSCSPFIRDADDCEHKTTCVSIVARTRKHSPGKTVDSNVLSVDTEYSSGVDDATINCAQGQTLAYVQSPCERARDVLDCKWQLLCVWTSDGITKIVYDLGPPTYAIRYIDYIYPPLNIHTLHCGKDELPTYARSSCAYARDSLDCSYQYICSRINTLAQAKSVHNHVPPKKVDVTELPEIYMIDCDHGEHAQLRSTCTHEHRDVYDCVPVWVCVPF